MSRLRVGNYPTGEPKHMYFKIHRHYPSFSKYGKIRLRMWIAQYYKEKP